MARVLLAMAVLLVPVVSMAADDFKVMQLETDVRDLQRQVQAQAQQIDELRMQLGQSNVQPRTPTTPAATPKAPAIGNWVDAAKWQRLRPGMSELEVVTLLGPPTSMRARDNDRVLLYAMEIGSSGFLGGSVTLRDRIVSEVQIPVLR